MFNPRPAQKEIIHYTSGKMGVSAVPGSGKTHTLSYLAASLIARKKVAPDQEVLVVTLVNSAVNNFAGRIDQFIREFKLIPEMGYTVCTLHSLAHEIVRERPDLVGLSDRFQIADEFETQRIMQSAVDTWLRTHPEFYQYWTSPDADLDDYKVQKGWPRTIQGFAHAFIRQSKDLQLTPQHLAERINALQKVPLLLQMGLDIYNDYQRGLAYRSSVDFDDLIRLALLALQSDPDYLARLRYRWPYVLEDEAQDSSYLQEQILRLLVGEDGNWVRVGDPNQAIFETFTTASPRFLIEFRQETGVVARNLPNSGRSTQSIISLANYLIDWTRKEHPEMELRGALTLPYIELTPPNDPQPNPPDDPSGIFFATKKYEPDHEIHNVVGSIKKWLPDHQDWTVAVLVPRNERGEKIIEALNTANIPYVELLRSSRSTRQTAETLASILRALAEPANPKWLSRVYQQLPHPEPQSAEEAPAWKQFHALVTEAILNCSHLEDYLWPRPGFDYLADLASKRSEQILVQLAKFRQNIRRWQAAALLPIDQLILTIASEMFTNPSDLALAHKLALLLENTASAHMDWGLLQFSEELATIARNERHLTGFSEEDMGFNPDLHRGKVVVSTMHKAKGLEWDRVYLLSVNNYDFPSNQPYDEYMSEPWFVRNRINIEAEAVAQLKSLATGDIAALYMEEGTATLASRFDYSAERLRLLYVGITRARRELIVTWNTGKITTKPSMPALPLLALQSYWKENGNAAT